MEVETKYTRSMRLMDSIRQGEGFTSEKKSIKLLDDLSRNGFIVRRPGRRNWASDSYDLTIKVEKTLDDYDKIGEDYRRKPSFSGSSGSMTTCMKPVT